MLKIALWMVLMVGISAGLECYQCDPNDPCPDADKLNATHVVTCTDGEDTCFKGVHGDEVLRSCIDFERLKKQDLTAGITHVQNDCVEHTLKDMKKGLTCMCNTEDLCNDGRTAKGGLAIIASLILTLFSLMY